MYGMPLYHKNKKQSMAGHRIINKNNIISEVWQVVVSYNVWQAVVLYI